MGSVAFSMPELNIPIADTRGFCACVYACMPPQLWPAATIRAGSTFAYLRDFAANITQSIADLNTEASGCCVAAMPLLVSTPFGMPPAMTKMPWDAISERKA